MGSRDGDHEPRRGEVLERWQVGQVAADQVDQRWNGFIAVLRPFEKVSGRHITGLLDDVLNGGSGNDLLDGGNGTDILRGEAGNDNLSGSYGNDILLGGTGNDTLFGRQDNDILIGGTGRDQLRGDAGNDLLVAGTTNQDNANDAALLARLGDGAQVMPHTRRG